MNLLYTVSKNVNCYTIIENSIEVSQKLKIGMPHDPITLLVTDQKERKSVTQRDIWAPMFNVELLMTDKIW